MIGPNSSNDRLILRPNVEIYCNGYFLIRRNKKNGIFLLLSGLSDHNRGRSVFPCVQAQQVGLVSGEVNTIIGDVMASRNN